MYLFKHNNYLYTGTSLYLQELSLQLGLVGLKADQVVDHFAQPASLHALASSHPQALLLCHLYVSIST